LIIGDHLERIEWLKCQLQKRIEITNLNDMSHYLIIEFLYLEERIFMTQKTTQSRHWSNSKCPATIASSTPMVENIKL
jgi:hypothetical protein